jgi:hypothetical protein
MPLDFDFPIGESYADANYEKHLATCPYAGDEDRDHDESCGYTYWTDVVPTGDGWQLWQTVSDGPLTPVFATADELIEFMSQPVPPKERPPYDPAAYPSNPRAQGWRRETAEKFVRAAACGQGRGRIPSMIIQGGRILSTDEMIPEPKVPSCARALTAGYYHDLGVDGWVRIVVATHPHEASAEAAAQRYAREVHDGQVVRIAWWADSRGVIVEVRR